MKKYKIMTAKNAVKKGLVKEGDEVWVKIKFSHLSNHHMYPGSYPLDTKIRIPIPEPKPIDFGEAGRVLKNGELIICTTGYIEYNSFAAYVLESKNYKKGWVDYWGMDVNWQDITDTYKP